MLNHAVLVCGFWMEFLYFCRAEFSNVVNDGIGMSLFNNLIRTLKR